MIVAQQKRKTNLAEYILYMWQVEDMIRAFKLDMDQVDRVLVSQYNVDSEKKTEISDWYKNLLLMMQKEQKSESGHLQFLVNLVNELNGFHHAVIDQKIDPGYAQIYASIKPDIEFVRQKSKNEDTDVEVGLNALYIILMLKMNKKEVSEGTQEAVYKFGNWLSHLSKLYKAYESGDIEVNY